MDLRDVLNVWRSRLFMIALCTLFGLAAAAFPAERYRATYTSSTQLFVSTPALGDTVSAASVGNSFASTRLASYVTLTSTAAVRQRAVAILKTEGYQDPGGGVSAYNDGKTVVITVSADTDDPKTAQELADATAAALTSYVGTIDRGATGVPLVTLTVVQPAGLGATGHNRAIYYLAAGLLGGLLLGLGLALLRETLDTTIRSSEELRDLTGSPVLGLVPYEENIEKRRLLTDIEVHAPRAEAYRQLRTNLSYVDVVSRPKSIVITSALPGEGKSVTAVNLALTLATNGVRVLLVDADMRKPRIGRYTGIDNRPGLTDVLIGRVPAQEAIHAWRPNVSVLTSGDLPPNPSELLGSAEMRGLLQRLENTWDIVILDSPPLLAVTDGAVLAKISSGTILVTRANRTTKDQTRAAVEALNTVGVELIGAVLNGVLPRSDEARKYGYFEDYYLDDAKPRSRRAKVAV